MSTIKSHLSIRLPDDTVETLLGFAKRDKISLSAEAVRLMVLGMEIEEDEAMDKIAGSRDREDAVFHPHAEAYM